MYPLLKRGLLPPVEDVRIEVERLETGCFVDLACRITVVLRAKPIVFRDRFADKHLGVYGIN